MTTLDRLGPHSLEAEEAVLGSILIHAPTLNTVSLFLEPRDFWELKHNWIYAAMLDMKARNLDIDHLTLADVLRTTGKLEEVGGPAYITYLINSTPTHIYAETYARLIQASAVRCRILKASGEIAQLSREKAAELPEIIADCQAALNAAIQSVDDVPVRTIGQAASTYYDAVEARRNNPDLMTNGYPSGIHTLDRLLRAFKKGGLYLIAARPGVGKTDLLINIARNWVRRGVKVLFVSLEMAEAEITERLVSAEAKIDSDRLQAGKVSDDEWDALVDATGNMDALPLFIEDMPSLTPAKLRSVAHQQRSCFGLDAICLDYLQLMTPDKVKGRRNESREQEVARMSQSLKHLARELRVPVIAACQLNREGVGEPSLHNLKDSGALEADADGAMLLWESQAVNDLHLNLAKHRHGPTGKLDLFYNKSLHTIAAKAERTY